MAEEKNPSPKLDTYYLEKIKKGLVRPVLKGSAYGPKRKKKKKSRKPDRAALFGRRYCAHCVTRVCQDDLICPICSWPTVRSDGLPDGTRPKRLKGQRGQRARDYKDWKRRRQYRQYISYSPAWKALRKQVIERDGGLCRRCQKPGNEVHHLTYRRLFNEALEDLELLCKDCHENAHPWKK